MGDKECMKNFAGGILWKLLTCKAKKDMGVGCNWLKIESINGFWY
jgi:hypothetical protein